MSTDSPRSVSLSPAAAVDSVAEWPLGQVVQYLRKKEKEETEKAQPVKLYCRSSIKSLFDLLGQLASTYGVSKNQMSRWLTYHGLAIAREDAPIARMGEAISLIRATCIQEDDTDTLDIMNSQSPYMPRIITPEAAQFQVYSPWTGSEFEELADVCGIRKYRMIQVFMVKSILSDGLERYGETGLRLQSELDRWDSWMAFRLGGLEILVAKVTECNTIIG